MADKIIKLSQEGYDALMAELEDLKVNKRKEIQEKLQVAREQGDLSENAEYDAAKEENGKVETRILELEEIKKHHIIIETSADSDTIQIGNTVTLQDKASKEKYTYKLKTSTEADILSGSISDESPVGRELIGKKAKDVIHVDAPNGKIDYRILSFQ